MRKLLAKLLYAVVIAEVIFALGLGFFAYFVRSFDKVTGTYFDGIGRQLELTPFVARFFLGADSLWPGWSYFALDFLVFWGGVALGYGLISVASKLERTPGAR